MINLLLGIAIGIVIGTIIEHYNAKTPGHYD